MTTTIEEMPDGQSLGLEEQLQSLSPILTAAMQQKAVINLNIYSGNIGQKIDHASQVLMGFDEKLRMIFKKMMSGEEKTTYEEHNEDSKNERQEKGDVEPKPPSDAQMAAACEQTAKEGLWWGDTSWSVVYVIYFLKGFKGAVASFVDQAPKWPFKHPFAYDCNRFSVGKPLLRGKITGPLDKWAISGASSREIKLGERLMELLP